MIKYIFHISDLHIRNGDLINSRYEEYKNVFDNTIIKIKEIIQELKLSDDSFITIITGDIFHNKNSISNYGLLLYREFIENICNVSRTILFHGNHDKNQYEIDQPSLPYSATFNIKNLTILNKTSSFVIDRLGFSYVNIDDTLDIYKSSGRISDLPKFPKILSDDIDYKIGLFHGPFVNALLDNGNTIKEDEKDNDKLRAYPLDWIKEFDYVLLGDIHKRQFDKHRNTIYGYSGSLIQQNWGETTIGHGFLLWDLYNKEITEYDVYNDKGFVYINEELKIKVGNIYYDLNEYINKNKEIFPRNINIKLLSEIDYFNLDKILKNHNITYKIINNKIVNTVKELSKEIIKDNNIIDINNNEYILSYFDKILGKKDFKKFENLIKNRECLLFNISDYPEELHLECIKKNKDITSLISSSLKEKIDNKGTFNIKYIEWEGLYCYEDLNYINLNSKDLQTFLINGKNGTGKSAIYDIILLAIWGEISTSKKSIITSGLINHKKESGYTIIDIEINNEIYRIERTFIRKKDDNMHSRNSATYLYKYVSDKEVILLKKDTVCKEEIFKLFGNIEDFLTFSMLTQNIDFNILKLDYKDCIELIDKSFNIEHIYNIFNIIKSVNNKYSDLLKTVSNKKQVYKKLICETKTEETEETIKNTEEKQKNLEGLKIKLIKEYDDIIISTSNINIDEILKSDYDIKELSKTNLIDEIKYNILLTENNQLKIILKDEDIKELYELYDEDITNLIEIKKPCDIGFIEEEEKFLSKYINKNEYYSKYNIIDIKKSYDDLNIKIKNHIEKKLTKINKPPTKTEDEINEDIKKIYDNYDVLSKDYINNNTKIKIKSPIKPLENHKYTYKYYVSFNKKQNKQIKLNDKKLLSLEEELSQLLLNNENIEKPTEEKIDYKGKDYDKDILKNKKEYQNIINEYDDLMNEIKNNEKMLNKYNKEEYDYDPKCIYCCKRPWITHKNKLEEENKLLKSQLKINKEEYDEIKNKLNYILYQEWLVYEKYKNRLSICSFELKNIKENTKELLEELELYNNYFNKISYDLYDLYNNIQDYNNYIKWEKEYNILLKDFENIKDILNYLENIKPRIEKLNDIKEKYQEWEIYDHNFKILNAYKYTNNLNKIKSYEHYIIKPLLIQKNTLKDDIKSIEKELDDINKLLINNKLAVEYNKNNKINYEKLNDIYNNLKEDTELFNTLIEQFKAFKIDLYDNYILKNLTKQANKIINSLCHTSTKPFKLSYLTTTYKDTIHINWLINDFEEEKKIISVNQASGFQQFSISIALRISLFINKNDFYCNQLFIDEGFTSFDKYNLSIVPSFIKDLLIYYNNIIVVSHIDLIQDAIDERTEILYDKDKNKSLIKYGLLKHVIKKRK